MEVEETATFDDKRLVDLNSTELIKIHSCPVCYAVVNPINKEKKPCQCKECHQIYCFDCFTRIVIRKEKCPQCRTTFRSQPVNRTVLGTLDTFKIRCVFYDKGCTFQATVASILSHEKFCKFATPVKKKPMSQSGGEDSTSFSNITSSEFSQSLTMNNPIVNNLMFNHLTPIADLHPEMGSNFTVMAKINSKSLLRSFTKNGKEHAIFSADLVDEAGSEIQAMFFGETAETFYPLLEEGKTYRIYKGNIGVSKSEFSSVKNKYQLLFEKYTKIQEIAGEQGLIERKAKIVRLKDIPSQPTESFVDVCGQLKSIQALVEVKTSNSGTGEKTSRRIIEIVDENTLMEIVLHIFMALLIPSQTLWGDHAKNFDFQKLQFIVGKALKVKSWSGQLKLSTTINSKFYSTEEFKSNSEVAEIMRKTNALTYKARPNNLFEDTEDVVELRSNENSRKSQSQDLPSHIWKRRDLKELESEALKIGTTKKLHSLVVASIAYIKSTDGPMYYVSCPNNFCKRKAQGPNGREWYCKSCDKVFQFPAYRYILSIRVEDALHCLWMSAFDAVGQSLFGMNAADIKTLKEKNPVKFNEVVNKACLKEMAFYVQTENEKSQGGLSVRHVITKIDKVNYHEETKNILEMLKVYDP